MQWPPLPVDTIMQADATSGVAACIQLVFKRPWKVVAKWREPRGLSGRSHLWNRIGTVSAGAP
jgi:hypothetical protein